MFHRVYSPLVPGAALGGTALAATLAGSAAAGAIAFVGGMIALAVARRAPSSAEVEAGDARALLATLQARVATGASTGITAPEALATREQLVARIAADGTGLIGLISFDDFERLRAFDPVDAAGALGVFVDRLRRIVGAGGLAAQLDRARFAVWYPDTAAADARFAALVYALGADLALDERSLRPQLAVASAAFPAAGLTPDLLIDRTLASLGHGDGADPVIAARDRYGLEQDLRHAVARGEFSLAYQPLIDAAAGRVCGAEALLRWHHPVRGAISPAEFVPVVEAIGLADEVGAWVLNTALREARGWAAARLDGLRVAVNLSGAQLARPALPAQVARALARHGLDPAALELELTETVATGDGARALFAQLRALGVAIAIDDFGTGFSSLSALRSLGFDKLKIDREFVDRVDERRDSQAICRSILALGQGLGIRVLAEGVERAGEYAWLRRHGCQHFQGYLFARPLDPAGFRAFVADGAGLARRLAACPSPSERRLA